MKTPKIIFFITLFFLFGCKDFNSQSDIDSIKEKPKVSFTFDDGITNDIASFKFEDWNAMILSHLEAEELQAIFFVTGKNKLDPKGQFLLKSWNDKGHNIANHTLSHPNFNSKKNTSLVFENELLKTDSIISNFSNKVNLFRFPYLKEGSNKTKVDSFRTVLKDKEYKNGYVTIDASDWYINQRLIKRIKKVGIDSVNLDSFKEFYVTHIIERAKYYESLSYDINKYHINHTLLLHHNLTSALFLDDLIKRFKKEGWEVISADTAYQDSIFNKIPNSKFAGESLIYSLAKQSGNYSLRYPAEDSRYEKEKMDALGL